MKSILKNYQDNDEIWKKDLAIMQDKHETENIYLAYLKLAADDSQANVSKRLELFQELLEKGFQSLKFQTAWKQGVPNIAYLAPEMPFVSALMAKVLLFINAKKNLRWDEYYMKFDPEDEE